MERNINMQNKKREKGYVLVGVLVLASLCFILTAGMLNTASSSHSIKKVVNKNMNDYYTVEQTLSKTVAWLQKNSKNIVTAFNATNFPNNFDTGSPALGNNEGSQFGVPTMVKMKGTNNSVMLSNNTFFGTSAFPTTTNIDTGATFNAVSSFSGTNLGGANARIILVWARQTDGNFEPVFRVDVVTGNNPDRGVHSYSYVYSALQTSNSSMGFYGKNLWSTWVGNNTCKSYQYTYAAGVWSRGADRTNCQTGSDVAMTIGGRISGTAASLVNPGVSYRASGAVTGTVCQGAGCHGYSLPTFSSFATYCPTVLANVAAANPTNLVAGATQATRCWDTVSVGSNKTLNFSTPNVPYYINNLTLQNNSNSRLTFTTIAPGNKYILNVANFAGGQVNGNQLVATNIAPHQLEINIISNQTFKLNGTAVIHANLTAPLSTIQILGNFNYYGAIKALGFDVTGNATFNLDEALGGAPVLSDASFMVKKASQRYR